MRLPKAITRQLLMVRPHQFRSNEQTAVNNYYQKNTLKNVELSISKQAQLEFDTFVAQLRQAGIQVLVVQDTAEPDTPDAIFPNNWISFHQDGRLVLYPMFAPNRRLERRSDILKTIRQVGYELNAVIDYSASEQIGQFLEGTGCMVLDRVHRKAYAARSPRINDGLFLAFCKEFNFEPILFTAYQNVGQERLPIYHTNVMMSVGKKIAVVCLESIDNQAEKAKLIESLEQDGKTIVAITAEQVQHFAGNVLEVEGAKGQSYLVCSTQAYEAFQPAQRKTLAQFCQFLHSPLNTIEQLGGGSARCMMAEIFLPLKG